MFWAKHIKRIKPTEAPGDWDWMLEFAIEAQFEPCNLLDDSRDLITAANATVKRSTNEDGTVSVGVALFETETKISVFGFRRTADALGAIPTC